MSERPFALDAVVFDFDGVIVDSVAVKGRAFAQLFADYPDHVPEILALHERLGGISRHVKFELIHRDILKQPLTPDHAAHLAARFAALVVEEVVACPMIAGAAELLDRLHGKVPLYIASGTPEDELRTIVARRGLDRYFAGVFGSPRPKSRILSAILAQHRAPPRRMLFLGDALTDYEAAREIGCRFVGVGAPDSPVFPPDVVVCPDLMAAQFHFTD